MFKRITYLLTTGLWLWTARVVLGDLGTRWVFDDNNPDQSHRWMFGGLEERGYATKVAMSTPAGQRSILTFNLFRSGLFSQVSTTCVCAAASIVTVVAFLQGFAFGREG